MRTSSTIRRWVAVSAAAVVALGLGLAPAGANPADTVDLPAVLDRAPSHKVVFAGDGVTVIQGLSGRLWRSTGGAWTAIAEGTQSPRQAGDVVWWRSGTGNVLTRLDPVTGATTATPLPNGYAAAVSEIGHITENANGTGFVYVEGGTTRALPGVSGALSILGLSTTAYLTATQNVDDTTTLSLVPLDGGAGRVVATLPTGRYLGASLLTSTSVFWVTDSYDGGERTVNRQPLAGGPVETATLTAYLTDIVADADTALIATDGPPQVFTGGSLRSAQVPAGVALRTLAAGGGRLLMWGTGTDRSGVYSVDPATGALTKSLATPDTRVRAGLTVNAGKVWGVDRRDGENGTGADRVLWNRTMGATPGAETILPYRSSAFTAFSANRVLRSDNAVNKPATVSTYDGAAATGTFTMGWVDFLSGPYLSGYDSTGTRQQVRRVDGTVLFTLPTNSHVAALFGSRVYYTDGSVIWLRDVALAASAPARKIATCACYSDVGAWGDWFVYAHGETGVITAINIVTGAVTSPGASGRPLQMAVDDGVVAWSESPGVIKAWNPAKNGGAVTVVTGGWSFDVDDGRIAWQDTQNGVHYGSLPFGGTTRPRFLGAMPMPYVFAPGAPGQPTTWTPKWDLTKNLSSWTLTIRSGSTTVRTLTGATVNASVRPSWDGRNSAGALVPNGTYTWTLTGSAADGSGPVAGVDGTSAVGGTIRVSATAPVGVTANPYLSTTLSATAAMPVTWSASGLAPGTTASYTVQYRTASVSSAGSTVYSAPVTWVSGTTATSKTYTGASGRVVQFRVQAKDSTGRVGPWSAFRTTVFPVDDRSLTAAGSWTAGSASPYYLGTYRGSGTKGASLSRTARTRGITVIGARSPAGGKVAVYVDGTLRATVDTYSAKAAYRSVLWTSPVPTATHTVKLVVLPTSSTRKNVYVDGIAFGL